MSWTFVYDINEHSDYYGSMGFMISMWWVWYIFVHDNLWQGERRWGVGGRGAQRINYPATNKFQHRSYKFRVPSWLLMLHVTMMKELTNGMRCSRETGRRGEAKTVWLAATVCWHSASESAWTPTCSYRLTAEMYRNHWRRTGCVNHHAWAL